MKKNRRGFTLVELLAVLVILGILSVFAIPTITRLVSSSREKMYINDTKKFISIAEAKMKANSSDIDEPDNNKCIVMNLLYLDNGDLKHAPNGGEYLKENSFVIVKKNGDDLEYSASLIEKTKDGGYVGTKLIKKSVLNTKEAINYVTGFKKEELLTSAKLDSNYINSQLGSNYVSGISNTYYFQDFSGSTYQAVDDSTPGFAVLNIASASSNTLNTVDAILKVIVEDEDSAPSELSLSIYCEDRDKGTKFCDDLASVPMGNSNAKQISIDFSRYGYTNASGGNIYVNVTVQDNQHNKKSKTLEYFLDKNKAPVIDYNSSFIKKRDADKEAMTIASFKLGVTDDLDPYNNLQVCLLEDDELESGCVYKSYTDYFPTSDTMDYQFHCAGNGCIRDGSTHKLKVYIKDSFGLVTEGEFVYNFSLNQSPVISNNAISIISTEENYNASKVKVKFSASDTSDASNKLVVHLDSDSNHMEYLYSEADDNGSFPFDFFSLCDGSVKNLTVTVFDTEGLSVSKTVSYQLYKNKKPTISEISAVSNGTACDAADLCPLEKGGSKSVNFTIKAKDDLDDANNIKMCVSDDRNYCNNPSNFISYTENINVNLQGDYDGSVKNIYAVVLDSYGLIEESSIIYGLYEDQPPVIRAFEVNSVENEKPNKGNLKVNIKATIDDDFDNREDLQYSLQEDELSIVNLNEGSLFLELENGLQYNLNDNSIDNINGITYDGSTRTIKLEVKDKSGKITTSSQSYTVYQNKAPVVDSFTITSDGYPCENPDLCPLGDNGNNGNTTVEYEITASDDLDNMENLEVCVSENDNCTDYRSYVDYYNANQGATSKMKWTFSVGNGEKPFDGSTKKLNVFVKDSSNYITKEEKEYTLYENQKPVIKFEPAITPIGIMNDLIYTVGYSDDLTNQDDLKIKYCFTVEGENTAPVCTDNYPYVEVTDIYGGTSGGIIQNGGDENSGQGQNSSNDSYELKNLIRLNSDNLFAGITEYNGQTLNVYSEVEDSYGLVTKSDSIPYVVYSDRPPEISISSAKIEDKYYTDSLDNRVEDVNEEEMDEYTLNLDLNVYYIASDQFDQYAVCLGKSETQCDSEYSDWYDGSADVSRHINYTYKVDDDADLSDLPLYIIIKDKNNNTNSEKITLVDDNSSNVFNTCMSYDLTKNKFQFSPKNNAQVISADYCEGKCYSVNPLTREVNSKFALYTKKQYRFDRYSDNVMCSPAEFDIKVNCSFKDCFYKNNNYQRKAIGFYEVIDQVPWTYTELDKDGNTVSKVANSHYQVYSSSYDEEEIDVYDSDPPRREKVGNESITLTLTPERVCPTCINKDEYKYSSSSSDPYVRINDFPDYNWGDYYEEVD